MNNDHTLQIAELAPTIITINNDDTLQIAEPAPTIITNNNNNIVIAQIADDEDVNDIENVNNIEIAHPATPQHTRRWFNLFNNTNNTNNSNNSNNTNLYEINPMHNNNELNPIHDNNIIITLEKILSSQLYGIQISNYTLLVSIIYTFINPINITCLGFILFNMYSIKYSKKILLKYSIIFNILNILITIFSNIIITFNIYGMYNILKKILDQSLLTFLYFPTTIVYILLLYILSFILIISYLHMNIFLIKYYKMFKQLTQNQINILINN